jgi:hypothetical protein
VLVVVGGGRRRVGCLLASNEVRDRTQPASQLPDLICEAISLPQDLLRGARRLARTVRIGDEAVIVLQELSYDITCN